MKVLVLVLVLVPVLVLVLVLVLALSVAGQAMLAARRGQGRTALPWR